MAARAPMYTYECPFLTGEDRVTCTTSINDQQYHTYCREIAQVEKEPNYIQCNAYKALMTSPFMTMKRIYREMDDMAQGQARGKPPSKV